MNLSRSVKIILFFTLFLLTLGLVYLFARPYFKSSGNRLVDILKKENYKLEKTNLLDYLKDFNIVEDCVLTDDCFEFYNEHEEWFSHINPEKITLPKDKQYFVIEINQKTPHKLGGIYISSRVPDPNVENNWFGMTNMFIATGGNNHRAYISIQDGQTESHIPVFDEILEDQQTTWYLIFDRQVKTIVITNYDFSYFREFDINKASGGKLPDGLFPDGVIHFGYGVEQYSYFIIDRFSIAPLY